MSDTNSGIQGMTVNERLFYFGLLEEFDKAATARDSKQMASLLIQVHFTPAQAEHTIQILLANPAIYGH